MSDYEKARMSRTPRDVLLVAVPGADGSAHPFEVDPFEVLSMQVAP